MTPPLQTFVTAVEHAVETAPDEAKLLQWVASAMGVLVAKESWLPEELAQPHPQFYQQYLLHCDRSGRFSVVSFVWGPGQRTPIHDHTVWGVIGMFRGAELSQAFARDAGRMRALGKPERLEPGDVTVVSPTLGDIHQVSNAFDDRVSISIHAYGADIGRLPRHVFDHATGQSKTFISGYAAASEVPR